MVASRYTSYYEAKVEALEAQLAAQKGTLHWVVRRPDGQLACYRGNCLFESKEAAEHWLKPERRPSHASEYRVERLRLSVVEGKENL